MNSSRAAIAGLIVSLGIGWHDLRMSAEGLVRVEASRVSMGCVYSIVAYAPDPQAAKLVLEEALDEVDRIDRVASLYRKDSALSRLNAAAGTPVRVDSELFGLIAEAMTYSVDSGGAFDVTVGPLLKAWGFFDGDGRVPAPEELAAIRQRVGYTHVALDRDAQTVRADRPGVEIDLGAIAKGYAVDRVAVLLAKRGITSALVSAGGSTINGIGAPPGAPAWDVAVQDPLDRTKVAMTLSLRDRSLSVSGGSERHFDASGVRYSHIMDPRTGRPSQGVLSVVALAGSGIVSDALGTALYVEGPERGRSLLDRRRGTEAYFFVPEGHGWKATHEGQALKTENSQLITTAKFNLHK
jgi:thiamine biosynthesis lipoprotein